MLRSLHVRNLAVLAGGEVELRPGLNVLTGETGAGKSLVVDSLALVAGSRAASDLIREGADGCTVSGIFRCDAELSRRLAEAGVEQEGEELVVRREITREGRNRVFLNDQPVTLRLLQELAPRLLRIHGQREELELALPELQRRWLDRSGGSAAGRLLSEVAAAYATYREAAERLERSRGDARLRRERIDLLRFQVEEIGAARVVAGEEEELHRSRDLLRHREAIARALGDAFTQLADDEGAAAERLAAAHRHLGEVAAWEAAAAAALPELAELASRTGDLARELRRRLEAVETEPGRLDEIEGRLVELERLFRKYGAGSVGLLAEHERMLAELADLDASDEHRAELERAASEALEKYSGAAARLSAARASWATELASRLARELADLALAKARFEVGLERVRASAGELVVGGAPVEFGPAGYDQVVFRFAANPGEPLMPLARVASGGELSRVSLALQLAARGEEAEGEPTLVFDEVDAGIGGAEGAALGRKLARLSRHGQILAVTHLAQVASFADAHHRVGKKVRSGRTWAEVETLDREARVEELARMLSSDKVTALSRSHAEEMLATAGSSR